MAFQLYFTSIPSLENKFLFFGQSENFDCLTLNSKIVTNWAAYNDDAVAISTLNLTDAIGDFIQKYWSSCSSQHQNLFIE